MATLRKIFENMPISKEIIVNGHVSKKINGIQEK